MKKLTAMLLSLTMCLSLLAIPAQAVFVPVPDGSAVIDTSGTKDPAKPGDEDPDREGNTAQPMDMPGPRDNVPTDSPT